MLIETWETSDPKGSRFLCFYESCVGSYPRVFEEIVILSVLQHQMPMMLFVSL